MKEVQNRITMARGDPPLGWLLGSGPRPVPIYRGDVLTFGRDQQNAFCVEDALASRRHAVVEATPGGKLILKDLDSRNGTWLNNESVSPGNARDLKSGDSIRIGGKLYYFISNTADIEPRKLSTQAVQQLTSMETVATGLYFKDGKVIEVKGDSALKAPLTRETKEHQLPDHSNATATGTHTSQAVLDRVVQDSALTGNLRAQGLPQILQFLHGNGMTGELFVEGKRMQGSMCFDKGQLFFAEAGAMSGPFAVYSCARESAGNFRFHKSKDVPARPKNINEPTLQVILESCRRMDELPATQKADNESNEEA